jgi:hypothetical protein
LRDFDPSGPGLCQLGVIFDPRGRSDTSLFVRFAPKATVDDHPYFSPLTHRGGRVIGTDTVGISLVLHVSSDDQECEQGGQDNPNVNAHSSSYSITSSARASGLCLRVGDQLGFLLGSTTDRSPWASERFNP